ENDRIGLVLFAGRPYLQMPLTTDHGAAKMYIQDASPEAVPTQGTVIGEALKMANTSFNSKERKYKAVILLSDCEDHDPEALGVEKKSLSDAEFIDYKGFFQWFLGIGLVLLLVEYFLPERHRQRWQGLKTAAVIALLLTGFSQNSSAQRQNALIRSGNRFYKQK